MTNLSYLVRRDGCIWVQHDVMQRDLGGSFAANHRSKTVRNLSEHAYRFGHSNNPVASAPAVGIIQQLLRPNPFLKRYTQSAVVSSTLLYYFFMDSAQTISFYL